MAKLQLCVPDNPATVKASAEGGTHHDKKRLTAVFSFVAVTPDGVPDEVACIRVWHTPAKAWAAVWLKVPGDWRGGHGSAGGTGYHKASAAVGKALESAGIALSCDIGGHGETAYPGAVASALQALGEARPVYMVRGY